VISGADAPARIDQAQERKTKMSQDKATYEGMFLLDAGNPDFQAASEPVRTILDRNEARALAIKPWDERRLAYEIKGRRRGLYVLSYFQAEPGRISEIERDCRLDERILRVLLLRRDGLTDEVIQAETPATSSSRKSGDRREHDKTLAEKEDQAADTDADDDDTNAIDTRDAAAADVETHTNDADITDVDTNVADAADTDDSAADTDDADTDDAVANAGNGKEDDDDN